MSAFPASWISHFTLELRNLQAEDQELAYTDFLALLIEDEIVRREQRKLVMRQRRTGINTRRRR